MFRSNANQNAKLNALDKSQAIIEFDIDGIIQDANANFLNAVGYSLAEIKGKHHSIFVEPDYKESAEYKAFWEDLRRGEFQAAEYKRVGKGGKEIWIQASYNPLRDNNGKVFGVIKYATDITAMKLQAADDAGQLSAINKSQAVIQFNLDGTILSANGNFLNTVGYSAGEIVGKHHSMFVPTEDAKGAAYKQFWQALIRGEYQTGKYRRVGKDGQTIWLEASYNPILDMNGKPFKVVKYATDITKQVELIENVQELVGKNVADIEKSVLSAGEQAARASMGASETSANVQTIAAGMEEMSAAVREISSSMNKSLKAVSGVVEETTSADQAVQKLEQATTEMNGIVELIQAIAGQINLLALNATIEAARAGDAGKGFAVVADEVKNLAKQAADATDKISAEITGIQTISGTVVTSLTRINDSIKEVESYVAGTAGAVEEQSAITAEVSSNMQAAAGAVEEIRNNLALITDAVEQSSQAVLSTKEAAESLQN